MLFCPSEVVFLWLLLFFLHNGHSIASISIAGTLRRHLNCSPKTRPTKNNVNQSEMIHTPFFEYIVVKEDWPRGSRMVLFYFYDEQSSIQRTQNQRRRKLALSATLASSGRIVGSNLMLLKEPKNIVRVEMSDVE